MADNSTNKLSVMVSNLMNYHNSVTFIEYCVFAGIFRVFRVVDMPPPPHFQTFDRFYSGRRRRRPPNLIDLFFYFIYLSFLNYLLSKLTIHCEFVSIIYYFLSILESLFSFILFSFHPTCVVYTHIYNEKRSERAACGAS